MRTRLAPLALVPLLALSGCSSGGTHTSGLRSSPAPTTSSAAAAVPGGVTPGATASTAPGGAVVAPPAGTGAGAAASTRPVAPLSTKAPGRPAAQKATAPGTYTLDSSGSVTLGSPGTPQQVSGTPTLTVSPLRGDLQHSTLHGDQGDTEQDLLVRDTGTYAASLRLTSPAFSSPKEFRPSPAVLLVPDPARVGAAWSWSGTSTDGKTTAHAANKIGRTEVVGVGGKRLPCVVLMTHLVLSGDISYTADITTWWSPDYRLPVKDHTVGNGTYNNIPFKTDISTLMRSVTPS